MAPDGLSNGTDGVSTSKIGRRSALTAIASAGAGFIGAGALGTASAESTTADATGSGSTPTWEETNGSYGQYEVTGTDAFQCLDANVSLVYGGPHSRDDGTIAHKFAIAMFSHSFEGEKNSYQYSSVYPAAPGLVQDANQFKVENPSGSEIMNLDHSYPGYVASDTSPNWLKVIKNGKDSLSEYEQTVKKQTKENPTKDFAVGLVTLAASSVIGAVSTITGVGTAASLAGLLFSNAGAPDSAYVDEFSDPDGYRWNFQGTVPINIHHVELGLKVPKDGDTHSATIEQEALVVDEDTRIEQYGSDNGFRWDLELPGEERDANLLNESSYQAYH